MQILRGSGTPNSQACTCGEGVALCKAVGRMQEAEGLLFGGRGWIRWEFTLRDCGINVSSDAWFSDGTGWEEWREPGTLGAGRSRSPPKKEAGSWVKSHQVIDSSCCKTPQLVAMSVQGSRRAKKQKADQCCGPRFRNGESQAERGHIACPGQLGVNSTVPECKVPATVPTLSPLHTQTLQLVTIGVQL